MTPLQNIIFKFKYHVFQTYVKYNNITVKYGVIQLIFNILVITILPLAPPLISPCTSNIDSRVNSPQAFSLKKSSNRAAGRLQGGGPRDRAPSQDLKF